MKPGRVTALAALAATSLLLVACGTSPTNPEVPELGNAVAEVSPPSTDPAGRVVDLPGSVAEVSDLERAGEVLGLRSGATLALGTLDDLESGALTEVDIPGHCGDLTATGDTFVLACRDEVLLVDAGTGDVEKRSVAGTDAEPALAAALTSTGELVVGSAEESRVIVLAEGSDEPVEEFTVAGPSDQLIAVPVEGAEDSVVRANHGTTTIQDVHWRDGEQGGTLRVGLGIGRIIAGEDGVVLASDNRGGQLAVYTATDVVRLHQTRPVPASPWGVAWDGERDLAWVTSTGDNTARGFDLSTGVPEEQSSFATVADAHNILALDDGTLVLASATGDGLQIVTL